MKTINESNFDSSVASGVSLVDFSATWCGPCRLMKPILEALSQEGLPVFEVDVSKSTELAGKYGVSAIPALLFFKDGEVKQSFTGVQKKEVLKSVFENLGREDG
jgi:thioredoxin 1